MILFQEFLIVQINIFFVEQSGNKPLNKKELKLLIIANYKAINFKKIKYRKHTIVN